MSPIVDADSQVVLAGWWRRVGATLADDLVLIIPTVLAADLGGAVAGNIGAVTAGVAVQGIYMVWLLSSQRGQTVGNRVAASRVRDALTGHTVSRQQAIRRWAFVAAYGVLGLMGGPLTITVGFIGLVDVLYPLFNPRKQTLHDKFAGTIVVKI
jgi:uncharacterized RDD family membrane protein YckC